MDSERETGGYSVGGGQRGSHRADAEGVKKQQSYKLPAATWNCIKAVGTNMIRDVIESSSIKIDL